MGIIQKRLLSDGKTERYDVRIHRRKGGLGTKDGALSQTFKTEREAKAWMNKIEHKVDKGENVSKTAERLKFRDAASTYIATARPTRKQKPGTPNSHDANGSLVSEGEQQCIATIVHDLGEFTIASLNNKIIQGWIDEFLRRPVAQQDRKKIHPYFDAGLDKKGKPKLYAESTVRRHFFVLKKVLKTTAVTHNFHLDPNLFVLLQVPRAWAGKRERRLEDGEEAKLIEAVSRGYVKKEQWRFLIEFALATAARMQEILKAEWSDISYSKHAWNIPEQNVKTSRFRQVPLSDKAVAALRGMEAFKKQGDARIFHQWADSSTLSKAWRRVVKRAGVDDFHFHDLRHEAVSRLFENTDLSDTEIMTITGHTSHEMLKGYAKLRPNSLAARLNGVKRGG